MWELLRQHVHPGVVVLQQQSPHSLLVARAVQHPTLATATVLVFDLYQASTGLSLRATAGLRLLPGSKADDILAAVRTYLATFPFKLKAGASSAISVY